MSSRAEFSDRGSVSVDDSEVFGVVGQVQAAFLYSFSGLNGTL